MKNLFYRGYLIHEDIPSICYTVFGYRPERTEVGSRSTALEAMRLVDGQASRRALTQARAGWLEKDGRTPKAAALGFDPLLSNPGT